MSKSRRFHPQIWLSGLALLGALALAARYERRPAAPSSREEPDLSSGGPDQPYGVAARPARRRRSARRRDGRPPPATRPPIPSAGRPPPTSRSRCNAVAPWNAAVAATR